MLPHEDPVSLHKWLGAVADEQRALESPTPAWRRDTVHGCASMRMTGSCDRTKLRAYCRAPRLSACSVNKGCPSSTRSCRRTCIVAPAAGSRGAPASLAARATSRVSIADTIPPTGAVHLVRMGGPGRNTQAALRFADRDELGQRAAVVQHLASQRLTRARCRFACHLQHHSREQQRTLAQVGRRIGAALEHGHHVHGLQRRTDAAAHRLGAVGELRAYLKTQRRPDGHQAARERLGGRHAAHLGHGADRKVDQHALRAHRDLLGQDRCHQQAFAVEIQRRSTRISMSSAGLMRVAPPHAMQPPSRSTTRRIAATSS